MSLEKELKFPCSDLSKIKQTLAREGACFQDGSLETNQVFDTPDKALKQKDILLRLREANRDVLCLKRPPSKEYTQDVKVREEIETDLRDPGQMRNILFALGYETAFRYEKYREKWSWRGCNVCLDLVPFGRFVEIEGEFEEIKECAGLLGLDMGESSIKTYQQLNREYRQQYGLPEDASFVFPEAERSKYIEKGSCF